MGNRNKLIKMILVSVLYLSVVLPLSSVQVCAMKRDKFISLVEGASMHNNHPINDILAKYNCSSCLKITEEDEKILIGRELNVEIDALSGIICSKVSSSLDMNECMLVTQRYLRRASSCFQIFIIGESSCRDEKVPSVEISGAIQLPRIKEDGSLSVPELGEGLLKELLKGLLMSTLEHKEYKSCAPCRSAMEDIHIAVRNTNRQIIIIKLLHEVCDVSDTYAAQCKKMVLVYGPLLLGNVQKMVAENDLCYMTHMCKDQLASPPPSKEKPHVVTFQVLK